MLDLMDLAIEMGMRQSEVLTLKVWQFKRLRNLALVILPDTKNGEMREVTLSKKAVDILDRWTKGKKQEDKLFTQTPADLRQRWRAACKSAGVVGLRWHDLRHEALSRMHLDKGMDVAMLRQMSGHRTTKILLDYVNPSHKDITKKLG